MNQTGRSDIRILPLVVEAFARVWHQRESLLRLGAIPLVLMFLVLLPLQEIGQEIAAETAAGDVPAPIVMAHPSLQTMILTLFFFVIIGVFSVNWLRQLTLGPNAVPGLGLSINARHLRFVLFMLTIGLVSIIAASLLSFMLIAAGLGMNGLLLSFAAFVAVYLVLLIRLSPVWVGIAIDTPMPLAAAWSRSAGVGLKLAAALVIIEVPVLGFHEFLYQFFAGLGLIAQAPLAYTFLSCIVELVRVAVQTAMFVGAYSHFVRETV